MIRRMLKITGFLFLIEDLNLPVGEKPHQKGFLVLDTPQIKELFQIRSADTANGYTVSSQRNGRLKGHRIPKSCLSRISSESRNSALESLSTTAREEIMSLRNAEGTFQNGRLHGFWVQQFANAELALADLR